MGWTGLMVESNPTKKERKEILDQEFTWFDEKRQCGGRIVKSTMVNSVYYGAYEFYKKRDKKEYDNYTTAIICLTHFRGYEFAYKDMTESMGPYEYNCPISILQKLSPISHNGTGDIWAKEWRNKCLETIFLKEVLQRHNKIKIKFDREEVELVKVQDSRFFKGKPYWTDGMLRYPDKYITVDSIISIQNIPWKQIVPTMPLKLKKLYYFNKAEIQEE